ncbi:hypothetical protein [Haloechinothrix sp. LS1_15]|uniref:hypothetical protein n=1 Tax=Haloechinothrix sp. LS1_15 TaxID=2652248 RepID=UPI0029484A20|nr:hypothetical protein [Haloechinothrix sp. LS1_15]MDV6012187.1 hypothetical protein [Haloechinothrix sp. LS1_15]
MNANTVCRYCARTRSTQQHRAPMPAGPICADCIEAGLFVASHGTPGLPEENSPPARLERHDTTDCESCGRHARETFLGFRQRKLVRVVFPRNGAVLCVECLDSSGDLINRAIRG